MWWTRQDSKSEMTGSRHAVSDSSVSKKQNAKVFSSSILYLVTKNVNFPVSSSFPVTWDLKKPFFAIRFPFWVHWVATDHSDYKDAPIKNANKKSTCLNLMNCTPWEPNTGWVIMHSPSMKPSPSWDGQWAQLWRQKERNSVFVAIWLWDNTTKSFPQAPIHKVRTICVEMYWVHCVVFFQQHWKCWYWWSFVISTGCLRPLLSL